MEILIFHVLEYNTRSDTLFLKVGMLLRWAKCNFHLLFAWCYASVHAAWVTSGFFFGSCCWLVVDFLMTKTSHSFSYMLLQRPILIVLLEDNWLFGPGYRMCWYLSFFQCLCLQFVYRWDLAIFPLGKRYRITVLPVFPLILFLWPWWWCCVQGLAQRP